MAFMTSIASLIQRRHRRKARQAAARAKNRFWLVTILIMAALLVVLPVGGVLGGAAVMYLSAAADLPTPLQTITLGPVLGTTELYDSQGDVLLFSVRDPLGDRRAWVTLDQLPPYVAQATLLLEDPNFLTTARFDLARTITRLWRNVLDDKPIEADLSLTGRLVRNAIAPPPEFISRESRAKEAALVAEINRRYTPLEVLEWHLNTNYYGNEIYGIDAAAQLYLGKRAVDLTLDEVALLVAIPPAPQYNPINNLTAARGRQADVLRALLAQGIITQQAYSEAANRFTPVRLDAGQTPSIAPEFAVYARKQTEQILDSLGRNGAQLVSRGGLRVTTTLDMDLYLQSECVLRAHLDQLRGSIPDGRTLTGTLCNMALYLPNVTLPSSAAPPDTGALVVIDVHTGMLKSMVGPAATYSAQPGPVLYPFVYFTAFLTSQYNAGTMMLDIPARFPGPVEGLIYTPSNPNGRYYGVLNLREAMGGGLLPSVAALAQKIGINRVLANAHFIGLNSLNEGLYDLSLLERGGTVSPLDVAYAYNVFAMMGQMPGVQTSPLGEGFRSRDPVAVLKIEDAQGAVLWEYDLTQTGANCTLKNCTGVFEKGMGYLVNDILSDQRARSAVWGENTPFTMPQRAAVVNGLTGDKRDNWTVGYTPQLTVGVHLARSDGAPLALDTYGLTGAAVVWRSILDYVYARDNLPFTVWERPPNIVEVAVCERSGLLPNGNCPVRREIFLAGTDAALVTDTFWRKYEINSQNLLLAAATTPDSLRAERVYFVPPFEALDWWKSNNLLLPPENYDTITLPDQIGLTQILAPKQLDYVGGQVQIRGSMDVDNMQYYQLSYGKGANPDQYFDITGQQTTFTPGQPLAVWDTTGLDGLYTLRLVVVLKDNTIDPETINVTVDNIPPVIRLSAGEAGQVFQWPGDQVIPLVAEVSDNFQVARVEFFHNGVPIGVDDQWPYGFEWRINRTGSEFFSAVAYDAIGNFSAADVEVEVVR